MKRRSMVGSALALVLATSVAAGQGGQAGPPLDDDHFPPTMAMLDSMLGLTGEQAAMIEPWRDSMLVESRTMREQAVAARRTFMAAKQNGVSADSVTALQNRFRASMMALMPYRMQFKERIRPHLTVEQAATMDQRHDEQMARMHQQTGKGCQMGQGGGGKGQGMGAGKGKACGQSDCPCMSKAEPDSGGTQP